MRPVLIFDYDGTIHNTMQIYESAFRSAFSWLVGQGDAVEREIPSDEIAGWLGMNSRDMWNSFMPELSEEKKEQASSMVSDAMIRQIRAHKAVWYPKAEEMLETLKAEGYPMLILSNCKIAYRKAHWEEFQMARWFDAFYDCESYSFAPKTEIIGEIKKAFPGPCIVIGDRKSDMDCAKACGSPFVGCLYGFGKAGELDGADAFADSVTAISDAVRELCSQLA